MQPTRLDLPAKQLPPQPNQLIDRIPAAHLQEAITQLARLIAKMAAARRTEADDE